MVCERRQGGLAKRRFGNPTGRVRSGRGFRFDDHWEFDIEAFRTAVKGVIGQRSGSGDGNPAAWVHVR